MITKITSALMLIAAMFAIAIPAAVAAPTDKNAAEKDRLRARSEQRYPDIQRYKSAGKVGETSSGYLEAVKKDYLDDSALKKLIDEENKDRKALYALIADEDGTDAALVAKRAAKRNIERAHKGEYVKQDGQWAKK
jgi:hypothetical protein